MEAILHHVICRKLPTSCGIKLPTLSGGRRIFEASTVITFMKECLITPVCLNYYYASYSYISPRKISDQIEVECLNLILSWCAAFQLTVGSIDITNAYFHGETFGQATSHV